MSSITYPTLTTARALNQKAIDGVTKYLSHVKTLTFQGTSYTTTVIKEVLQAEIDANTAADEGQAQYRQQVVAAKLARSKGRAMRKLLKAYVLYNFGPDAVQTLQGFGMTVPKTPGLKSAQTKADAAAQGKATRAKHKEALESSDSPPPTASVQAANVTPPKS